MGSNGQFNGITSEFRYTMNLPEGTVASGPQPGVYDGYFIMKTNAPVRYQESLFVEFSPKNNLYGVSGNGKNKFGDFSMDGVYNPETMEMICSKLYIMSFAVIHS